MVTRGRRGRIVTAAVVVCGLAACGAPAAPEATAPAGAAAIRGPVPASLTRSSGAPAPVAARAWQASGAATVPVASQTYRPPSAATVPVLARTGKRPRARLVTAEGVRRARAYAAGRAGAVAFAVADERGRIRGADVARTFPSASVSKAMILVAALRAARHRALSAGEQAVLRPMITESDNDAAWAAYRQLGGGPAVSAVARLARMTHFREVGYWSDEEISAADQARLFFRLDALLPARHRAYGRSLLASVVAPQRWGMPSVAKARGLRILFKGGWRSGLTHQVARLEVPGGRHVAIAVLTTDAPSMAYSEATIAGIAGRLLSRRTTRGRLVR